MKQLAIIFALVFSIAVQAQETKKKYTHKDPEWGFLVEVGEPAPNFKTKLANGEKLKLKKLRGKVVLLQFTASWCKVCVKEMPYIEREIWLEHQDKDFIVIGVDRDEPLEDVLKFIEKTGVTYPIALDPGAEIFKMFAEEKSGVTRNVLIDKQGKVRMVTRLFKRKEFNEMKERIAELIAE